MIQNDLISNLLITSAKIVLNKATFTGSRWTCLLRGHHSTHCSVCVFVYVCVLNKSNIFSKGKVMFRGLIVSLQLLPIEFKNPLSLPINCLK